MSDFNSRSIIERMREVERVQNDKELAERMGVEAGTLSKWKSRNSLPIDKIIAFSSAKGISIDWLISGNNNSVQLEKDEVVFLTAYRQLDQPQRAALLLQMSGLGSGTNGGVVQSGDGNNHQVFHGDVSEVTGIRK